MCNNLNEMYRPLKFSEVIGQEVAIKLIKNGLKNAILPRTIIFHGPSGVGKTTLARLIAAWFVCENKVEDDVCGECGMCKAVQSGSITDLLELDAASHTSVDDIRDILEQCNYAPQFCPEKIFIIDEAHMLSRNAIAALLKIFEETALHIRFILATTEIEKIPDAIRNRCFCIPLKEIKSNDMIHALKIISQKSNINIDLESLELIMNLSHGSMREAFSILQQAAIFSNNINCDVLNEILSFAKKDDVEKLANLLLKGDAVNLFELLTLLCEKTNISSLSVLMQLIQYFRELFVHTNEKDKVLKILIDLNKLFQDATKISCFWEMILIGICEIAYEN